MQKNIIKLLFLAILLYISVATSKAKILYKLTILGTLGEYDCTTPLSINNNGQIVGVGVSNIPPNHSRAILFDTTGNGQNIDLGTLGGQDSRANFISSDGRIVGWATDSSSSSVATLFDPTGGQNNINLGKLNGRSSQAQAINDSVQIVGEFWPPTSNCRAVLFDSSGNNNSIILDNRPGVGSSGCSSINSYGQIVGTISSYNPIDGWQSQACIFDPTGDGNNIKLGTITGDGGSSANYINDNNQIIGVATSSLGYNQAALFDPTGNGNNINLGSISGYESSEAYSINNHGQIVGLAYNDYTWTAVLFDATGNGNNIDLNTLIDPSSGWNLMLATAINDNGWIVGYAMNTLGKGEAFLLTPITVSTKPIADADGPYTIYVGDTLTLDGSGSTDEGNDIVSYLWDLDDNNSFETDAGGQAIFDVNYTYLQSLGLIVDNTYNIHLKVTDSENQNDTANSTLTIIPQPALQVAVDIKPGSCPNPLNVKSSGVLPVAILGTTDVNVITIDPTSIQLAGVDAIRHSFEDVAAPIADSNNCNCIEDGPDGLLDLTLKFKTQDIVEAIGDVNDGDVLVLELTGVLFDETPIEGTDCVLIVGKHKPCNKADFNRDGKVDMADFAEFAGNWLQSSIVED
jgi:uncharacterized membrane protein